jgi:FeS assembly SUF system protein
MTDTPAGNDEHAPSEPSVTVFEADVVEALRTVYDPEIPINIYDLGLIYELRITPDQDVLVQMTLTTPNCPEAERMPVKVREAIQAGVPGVRRVVVSVVWDPPWTREMMSEDARMALGL